MIDEFSDATLTEAFWRNAYPTADDAEIAERLALRREQVAAHAALCDTEASQDAANLAARADQPGDDSDEDELDIDELLAARTVIREDVDEDEGVIFRVLSPLPISIMQPYFNHLVAAGYHVSTA